jgi:hypothetical protein
MDGCTYTLGLCRLLHTEQNEFNQNACINEVTKKRTHRQNAKQKPKVGLHEQRFSIYIRQHDGFITLTAVLLSRVVRAVPCEGSARVFLR